MAIGSILIVGSSARAAAHSALRSGIHPLAIDQFNDRDLTCICPAKRVADYPFGIVDLAREFPACPFLYTGALENYPEVVAAICQERPVLGNGPEALRAVRDPIQLHRALVDRSLLSPQLRQPGESLPPGEWLSKPLRSGGGIGIQPTTAKDAKRLVDSRVSTYEPSLRIIQQYIPGEPISASFLGDGRAATWLGATRQLVGCEWAGSDRFLYVGNIGPLPVSPRVSIVLSQIGSCIAQQFGLQGLFGVDAILRGDEVWVLEVNPRYTGAIEVLERASHFRSIQLHMEACQEHRLPATDFTPDRVCGKAIMYARRQLTIPQKFAEWSDQQNAKSANPRVADLPAAGTVIQHRHPICTVFVEGRSIAAVESSLQELAKTTYAVVEDSAL